MAIDYDGCLERGMTADELRQIRQRVEHKPYDKKRRSGGTVTATPLVDVKFTQRIRINEWHPTPLNRLLSVHWGTASGLKKVDRECIAHIAWRSSLRRATGHRRVGLTIFLRPKQRAADSDAYWKSLLDALVHAGLLIDDSRTHCTLGPVEFVRANAAATLITLEDM